MPPVAIGGYHRPRKVAATTPEPLAYPHVALRVVGDDDLERDDAAA